MRVNEAISGSFETRLLFKKKNLAGLILPARSSCVAVMDESSNTSLKEIVYLVYNYTLS
jgi:hypothetical protein